MRAIWKGSVAFGLVNVPIKLYAATGEHEVTLHQVHREDAGRIRYRKTCSVCGETVETGEIAKGFETDDGRMVILTDEDLAALPLATEREIEVLEFVPAEQVDPIMLGKTYYLEPEKSAAKPYALLRGALASTDRMAVVKVALRQRESMAVLRVRGDVICLQTLLWPDEVRSADFPILEDEVKVRPQELTMASSLVDSLAGDFDPSSFEDTYDQALTALIEEKAATGRTTPVPVAAGGEEGGEVIDLLSALQRSVEKARAARGGANASEEEAPEPTTPRKPRAKAGAKAAEAADEPGAGAETKKPAARRTSARSKTASDGPSEPSEPSTAQETPKKAARRRAS